MSEAPQGDKDESIGDAWKTVRHQQKVADSVTEPSFRQCTAPGSRARRGAGSCGAIPRRSPGSTPRSSKPIFRRGPREKSDRALHTLPGSCMSAGGDVRTSLGSAPTLGHDKRGGGFPLPFLRGIS